MKFLTFKNKTFNDILYIVKNNDFVEIRLDLNDLSTDELKKILNVNNKILITSGIESEKFENHIETALNNNVGYLDIPFDSLLLKNLEKGLTKLIISYHNYQRTPYEQGLIEIIDKMNQYKPDFLKIVTKANKKTDAMRILQLHSFQKNLIAYTFGRNTEFSRFSSYYLGAPILYASIDNNSKTAPGQPTIEETEQIINIIG